MTEQLEIVVRPVRVYDTSGADTLGIRYTTMWEASVFFDGRATPSEVCTFPSELVADIWTHQRAMQFFTTGE